MTFQLKILTFMSKWTYKGSCIWRAERLDRSVKSTVSRTSWETPQILGNFNENPNKKLITHYYCSCDLQKWESQYVLESREVIDFEAFLLYLLLKHAHICYIHHFWNMHAIITPTLTLSHCGCECLLTSLDCGLKM